MPALNLNFFTAVSGRGLRGRRSYLVVPAVMASKVYGKSLRVIYLHFLEFVCRASEMWYLLGVPYFLPTIFRKRLFALERFCVGCGLSNLLR